MTRESPRDSETRTGNGVTRERRGSRSDSEKTSGERRHAPQNGERRAKRTANGERRDSRATESPRSAEPRANRHEHESNQERLLTDGGDDIPLNIVGHDDRKRPGSDDEDRTMLSFTDEDSSGTDGDEGTGENGLHEEAEEEENVEPVELLVQLAKDGEIDPWDIDIVRVTDRFLAALDEADLRTSGRALFYASVLLRMKSDELFATDEPEDEELPPWEAPFADEPLDDESGTGMPPGFDPVESLEAEMERRLERKHARGKPETLDELVRDLREAERGTWWKESRTYDTSDSPRGYNRGMQELHYHSGDDFRVDDEPTANDVTHTAHEEDIEAVIDDVWDVLAEQYEKGREEVLYAEIDLVGGTRVMTYLALLFLAHRGRICLEQDELFGDLWIQQVTVEAEPTEAIAD